MDVSRPAVSCSGTLPSWVYELPSKPGVRSCRGGGAAVVIRASYSTGDLASAAASNSNSARVGHQNLKMVRSRRNSPPVFEHGR